MFARDIHPAEGPGKNAEHRADVNNAAVTIPAHRWQNGLNDTQRAEEIRLKQEMRFLNACFFQCPGYRVARIVNRMSICPALSKTDFAAFFTLLSSVTSMSTNSALAMESTRLGSLTVPNTRAPRSASSRAVCRPMPEETPVINTTLFSILTVSISE